MLALVTAYGIAGYMLIEHFSVLDAAFMTVITVTTVGYEEVHHLDAAGQLFTISLIVFGVVGFLYTFSVLVELISSGRLQDHGRKRRIDAQLRALRDHVIVCGYGRTGRKVARELTQSNQPHVVVEGNPESLAHLLEDEQPHIVGDAASDDVLHRAGIERARALVSAVDNDERCVFIVLTARSLNPGLFIVARSSYPESVSKLQRAGADRVVSPYTLSGHRMAALALQPAVVDALDMVMAGDEEGMGIEELLVPQAGRPFTVGALRKSGALLLAVRTPGGQLTVGPADDEQLPADSLLVAMGTNQQLRALGSALSPRP